MFVLPVIAAAAASTAMASRASIMSTHIAMAGRRDCRRPGGGGGVRIHQDSGHAVSVPVSAPTSEPQRDPIEFDSSAWTGR
ncbi:hypothetical protein SHLA_4c000990 [Shinella sp. DD12]|nr:hypothetical protein SHLA_4c000990 [Shinella sp. DD12]